MNKGLARLPPVPITNTSVCNNIDVSIQDIPPVPIVDTPVCSNVNNNIQNIPSLLSDNVNPQQNPGALKLLIKSYSDLYSQSIAIKEFPLNDICVLQKEVYTNKDRMEHLISSLQDKNKIMELTIKILLLAEENLKLWNKLMENHIVILSLNKESMPDEPLSKNLICSRSIKEQMTEFLKKIMKNISNIKFIQ